MARIRSIKPEFFTSEVVASQPISARLTFVGLWTHCDDNGVAVDNPKLIAAAIWPLEDDPRETLRRVSGDLQSLSTAGLIQRYETNGKQYLFVRSWDEHQKVSHPGKERYPRPNETLRRVSGGSPETLANPPEILGKERYPRPNDASTSGNETLRRVSGGSPETLANPPEILRPEQGAGSREQGAGCGERRPSGAPTETERLIAEYRSYARIPSATVPKLAEVISGLLRDGYTTEQIRKGLDLLHHRGGNPGLLPYLVQELVNPPKPAAPVQRAEPGAVLKLTPEETCPLHRGQRKGKCGLCRAARLAAGTETRA